MAGDPPSKLIRALLWKLFPTDNDLVAFCQDHFPAVARDLGAQMERQGKHNLLFSRHTAREIADVFLSEYPDELTQELKNLAKANSAFVIPDLFADCINEKSGKYQRNDTPQSVRAINNLPYLEVRFEQKDGGWVAQLAPEGQSPRKKRAFVLPTRPHQTLQALFHEELDTDLIDRPWRLRVRPTDVHFEAPIPDPRTLVDLRLSVTGSHIIYNGWTVSEMVGRPGIGYCSGRVAVIGSSAFVASLTHQLRPRVQAATATTIPQHSILIVEKMGSMSEAQQWQQRAFAAGCPLIIWGEEGVPPRSEVAEVLILRPTREPIQTFITHLLTRLFAGYDPEQAFAYSLLGAPEDVCRRWLRGAFSGWKVDTPAHPLLVDTHWYMQIDRMLQEAFLATAVRGLVLPQSPKRVLIVLSSGPSGAAPDLFIQRTPPIGQDLPEILTEEHPVVWCDNPANQEQKLRKIFDVQGNQDLVEGLLRRAHSLHMNQGNTHSHRTLFILRHDVAVLQPQGEFRQVSLDELKNYFKALSEIGLSLAQWQVRILVYIALIGAKEEQLASLRIQNPTISCITLETLSERLTEKELRHWLDNVGMQYTPEDLSHMLTLSYDELIQWLVERYPELRAR